jgi:hypothetical protein
MASRLVNQRLEQSHAIAYIGSRSLSGGCGILGAAQDVFLIER